MLNPASVLDVVAQVSLYLSQVRPRVLPGTKEETELSPAGANGMIRDLSPLQSPKGLWHCHHCVLLWQGLPTETVPGKVGKCTKQRTEEVGKAWCLSQLFC